MRLTIAGCGQKHDLEVDDSATVRSVKQQLMPVMSIPVEEMRLIFKGKTPDDGAALSVLGASDGAKLMLMRGKAAPAAGSRSTTTASAAAAAAAAAAVMQGDAKQPAAALPAEPAATIGEGAVSLSVAQGRTVHSVRCEAETLVRELKGLLSPVVGAAPGAMRLLVKGKEAQDGVSVESLGLLAGGKLMLLFREAHHQHQEGVTALAATTRESTQLRARVEKVQHRVAKRLLGGPEALAELGALDEEVQGLVHDATNAVVTPGSAVATEREKQAS
uniref:Ubiquitin-like domain-containing protein n=1 Tax=Haptolina ericina TaxID=156174 RepID=A0A7S3ADX6_9EUKA|mmetsp:Transcript_10033/g.22820  ORF Transcript_10033/g.22820 Transcript_10033/m.22820 type:complete len:275 (+) Transcript_10033:53-877(+)